VVAAAAKWSDKKVELSDALKKCREKNLNSGFTLWYPSEFENDSPERRPVTLRAELDHVCGFMQIMWHYDRERDVIVLDLPWCRPSSKSLSDLLADVEHLPRPAETIFGIKKWQENKWWEAFDGLLSSKENFAEAWEVRTRGDVAQHFPMKSGIPLLVSRYRNAGGSERVLVVIGYPMSISPGAGHAGYYLFDSTGRFVAGGVIGTGHRCSDVRVEFAEGKTLKVVGYHNGNRPVWQEYDVGDDGLTFRSGSEKDGLSLGKFIYRTPPMNSEPES
jgi:hypothetical protein